LVRSALPGQPRSPFKLFSRVKSGVSECSTSQSRSPRRDSRTLAIGRHALAALHCSWFHRTIRSRELVSRNVQPLQHHHQHRAVPRRQSLRRNLAPMPGVFPDYPSPVTRNNESGTELAMMRRGMPPPPRTGGPPVTNVRNTSSPRLGLCP
jgi:hypothetical protein